MPLAGSETGHRLDERRDGERLEQHRRRAEPIGLFHRLFVRGAHDDRRRRVALPYSTNRRARKAALVAMETHKISDHQIGSGVHRRVLQMLDEQELVALIAEDLAKEISDGAIVFDDQDSSHFAAGSRAWAMGAILTSVELVDELGA